MDSYSNYENLQGGCYIPETEEEKKERCKGIIKRVQYRTERETGDKTQKTENPN